MQTLKMFELINCHLCSTILTPHPLFSDLVAKTCPNHGDFFIQKESDGIVSVVFRAFDAEIEAIQEKPKRRYSHRNPNQGGHKGIPVRCDQTGETYPSMKRAAIAMGIQHTDISKQVRGESFHVSGYTFTKLDSSNAVAPFELRPRVVYCQGGGLKRVLLRCDQTGVIYGSVREAARGAGVTRAYLYRHLKGRVPKVKGLTFTKVV